MGHYEYVIETFIKGENEAKEVRKRYTEFVELYKLLQIEHPGAILPPIPPKDPSAKIGDKESEQVLTRLERLQQFLKMLAMHKRVSASDILKSFLTDRTSDPFTMSKYLDKAQGQFSLEYLIECSESYRDDQALADFRSQGIQQGLNYLFKTTNRVIRDKIWGSQTE